MICPNCGYKHGWGWYDEEYSEMKGDEGEFYINKIPMVRSTYYDRDEKEVYGCPKCGILFMNLN